MQKKLYARVGIQRIERSVIPIGKYFAHSIVARNYNKALVVLVVEHIEGLNGLLFACSGLCGCDGLAIGHDVFSRDVEGFSGRNLFGLNGQ